MPFKGDREMDIKYQDLKPLWYASAPNVRDSLELHGLDFNNGDKLPMDKEIDSDGLDDLPGEDEGPRVTIWLEDHQAELEWFVDKYGDMQADKVKVMNEALDDYRRPYDKAKYQRNGHATIGLQIQEKVQKMETWWVTKEQHPKWQDKQYKAIVCYMKYLYKKERQGHKVHMLLHELIKIQVKRDSLCHRFTETMESLKDTELFHWDKMQEARAKCKEVYEDRKDTSDLWEEFFKLKKKGQEFWDDQPARVQAQYWQLVFSEVNPYYTNGDTEEVDSMIRLFDEREHLEDIRLAHNRDQEQYTVKDEDKFGYWDWDYLIDHIEEVKEKYSYRNRLATSQFWNLYRLAKRSRRFEACTNTLHKLAKLSNPKTRGWWFREDWFMKEHIPQTKEEKLTIKMGRLKKEMTVKELEDCIPTREEVQYMETKKKEDVGDMDGYFDACDQSFWQAVQEDNA